MGEGWIAGNEPFMVLLGAGGCRLLGVREALEVTESVSVEAILLFRLKKPMLMWKVVMLGCQWVEATLNDGMNTGFASVSVMDSDEPESTFTIAEVG